jgi:c-di-GMP-binding flagellar brake protein YcgR
VYFNNDSDFIVSTLLDIDVKKSQLIFDIGADPAINEKLLLATSCNFSASPDGIKIQFSGKKVVATTWRGNPALIVPLPDRLIKVQRREYYRIQTPSIDPLSCTMRHPELGLVKLKLFDISLGGVGLVLTKPEGYGPYQIFADCRLDLRDFGDTRVDLQSRNIITIPLKNNKQMIRMGCRFVKLNAKQETLLQRVIAQFERERNALGH